MLKNIDPLLHADLLYVLRSMGHGDYLVISDSNFPAESVAKQTSIGRLLRLDNTSSPEAVRAILSVMPLDTFIDDPAKCMQVVDQVDAVPEVRVEVQQEIDRAEGKSFPLQQVERFTFYELAKKAYAVVQTGERRFYGCFILTMGVIPPDE